MLKKKNIYVISVTVLIAALVIISSFLSIIVYLQWHQLVLASRYYETLARLDTISYIKNIEVDFLRIRLGFNHLPVVEGRIHNKGKRVVTSLAVKINFLDSFGGGRPVYSYVIYPLTPFRAPDLFEKCQFRSFAFLREGSIEPVAVAIFKCILWHCPRKFVRELAKNAFSDKPGEWCGKIESKVVQIRLKPI